jgi:hypothetical protein
MDSIEEGEIKVMENNWEKGYNDGLNSNPPKIRTDPTYMKGYNMGIKHVNGSGEYGC